MTKALITLISVLALAGSLPAQDSASVPLDRAHTDPDSAAPYRSPSKAATLGKLFPGGGQFYSGELLRGYGYYLGTIGGVGMGAEMWILGGCGFDWSSKCHRPDWPAHVLGTLAIGAGIASWVAGARDAPHAAERANERHRHSTQVKPQITIVPGHARSLGVGLAASW